MTARRIAVTRKVSCIRCTQFSPFPKGSNPRPHHLATSVFSVTPSPGQRCGSMHACACLDAMRNTRAPRPHEARITLGNGPTMFVECVGDSELCSCTLRREGCSSKPDGHRCRARIDLQRDVVSSHPGPGVRTSSPCTAVVCRYRTGSRCISPRCDNFIQQGTRVTRAGGGYYCIHLHRCRWGGVL